MLSNRLVNKVASDSKQPIQLHRYVRFCLLLAVVCLTLMASAVLSFSVLADVPVCWRQPAEARLLELESSSGPVQRFVQQDDADGAGQLALYRPDSAVAEALLNEWPFADEMGAAAPFYAGVQPLDNNYDGLTDQLLSIDFTGRVWQVDVTASRFSSPLLLADLNHPDWRFIASAGTIEVSLPLALRPPGVPARYRLLIIIARHVGTGEDALLVVRLPSAGAEFSLLQFSGLTDRTELSAAERETGLSNEQWQAIGQAHGWLVRLSGQITQAPKVVAGVIYSAVATSDFSAETCATEGAEHSLVALNLHHAGRVYSQRWFRLPTGEGVLTLRQQTDGSADLVLVTDDEQNTALAGLKIISPQCPDCSEILQLDQFPRWLKLATYRQETGAH
tara:strand:+ start:28 stop:1200 length:1173 start_codon:yes stop_codon:yes gene_type:complete